MIRREPETAPARRPSTTSLAALGVVALLGVCGFVALGTWQIQRRAWKHDLIAHVDARVHAAAVAAPAKADWPQVTAEADAYRAVVATGILLDDRDALVQAVTDLGAGFWVMTPLLARDGTVVLVNRGFVPMDRRDPAARARIVGETRVAGLLRMTEPGGGFLRANDPAANRWYSRDVAAIAAARGLSDVAPYFIDADATPNPGGLPVGGLTVVAFSDNHLVYAATWFVLGALVAGGYGYVVWDARKAGQRAR